MPRPRRARKTRPRKAPARRGRRIPRAMPVMAGKNQVASCIETLDLGVCLTNAGQLNTFTLGQFPRAYAMATLFSFYKASKVTWTYEPLYNTFQEGVGAVGKPYILLSMNRQQESLSAGYRNLLSAGARPVPLAGIKKISYVPNWCSPGLTHITANFSTGDLSNLQATGLQKQFDWIATPATTPLGAFNPGSSDNYTDVINETTSTNAVVNMNYVNVAYNGHASHIFQDGALNTPIARLTCQVHWVFKGAKNNYNFPSQSPLAALAEPVKSGVSE